MTRFTTFAAAIALGAILLTGCPRPSNTANNAASSGGEQKKQLIVGFSQVGAESSWRTAETTSIQDEAEKRGVLLRFSDAQGDQSKQVQAVRDFIQQRVDAIILAPKTEDGWEEILEEARQAEIPVILVDRGVSASDELYATKIASDFVAEGRLAAEWLAEKTGGKCNIVELQGSAGADPATDRKQGFAEVLEKYPDMKIIKSQDGDFNLAKGKEVMEAFLLAEGDNVDAVYAHNDDMALGAIQAIEAAGKKPGEDIILVSIDAVRGAFEAMVEGKLNCTVECTPILGPYAFDAVEKTLAGEKLDKWIVVDDQVFDQSKAAEVLPTRKY